MTIELEPGVWLADGDGDPPRTLDRAKARQFSTSHSALKALEEARSYRPFEGARLHD